MPITISGSTGIAGVDGSASTPAVQGTDTNTGVYFGADTISFSEGGALVGQFDSSANFQFNSGYGSVATAYGCRAWVNFNGTGTVAIRASGNVTSITDSGTGQYTVNFTNSMPDANYSAVASLSHYAGVSRLTVINVDSPSTNSIGLISAYGDPWGHYDPTEVYLAIFR